MPKPRSAVRGQDQLRFYHRAYDTVSQTRIVPERKELTSSAVRKRLVPDRAVSAEGFGRRSNVPRWREEKVVSQLLYAAPVRV